MNIIYHESRSGTRDKPKTDSYKERPHFEMKRTRTIYRVSGILGGVLLLMCLLLLAAPFLIDLEGIQKEIKGLVERETGGRVEFRKLSIAFLPRPHAVLRDGEFTLKERKALLYKSLTVYPKLLPLLKGDVVPDRISLSYPKAEIDLTSPKKTGQSPDGSSQKGRESTAFKTLEPLIEKTDGLEIEIENGLIDVTTQGKQEFRFSDITLSSHYENKTLTVEVHCTSNLFKSMRLNGKTEMGSLKTKGALTVSGLKSDRIPNHLQQNSPIRLEDGVMDLETEFDAAGLRSLNARFTLRAPLLTLSREQGKATFKGVRLGGSLQVEKGSVGATLSQMTLSEPALSLAGTFKKQEEAPALSLHLEGKDVDVPSVRSSALDLAGDLPNVQDVFDIVRGGKVPSITVDAKGKTLAELGDLTAYTIQGIMRDGEISLTDPDLDLTEVTGSALIAKGTLSGQRLEARTGKTKGKSGILNVSLENEGTPFHLDIQVVADLGEAHDFLKRVFPEGPAARQLERIRSVEGEATARVRFDEPKKGEGPLKMDVDCTALRMKALYQSMPLPIVVTGGRVRYQQENVQLLEVAGSCGGSRFSNLSGQLNWESDKPRMEITSLEGSILLEDLHPFLSRTKNSTPWLKDPESLKGRVSVLSLAMKGPLKDPAEWWYQGVLGVENLFLDMTQLPAPLKAGKARLNITPQTIRFSDARIEILDSHFNMTGALGNPLKGTNRFETSLSGTLGAKGIKHLYHTLEMPDDLLLNAPIQVASGRFLWIRDTRTSLLGDLDFPGGARVRMDVTREPGKLDIQKLTLEDGPTRASLRLLAHEELADLDFSGKIQKSTLDSILPDNPFLGGWIEGDVSARILPKQSFSTSAEGFLRGNDILIYGIPVPAKIVDFALRFKGQQLRIESFRMLLHENRLIMTGNADLSTDDPRFDVDITTGNVDLDKILAFLKASKKKTDSRKEEAPWEFPIKGTAHLMWDSLKIDRFVWQPFQGEIRLGPREIRVAVENANLCGISAPGVVRIKRDNVDLRFRLRAEKADLNKSITCLTKERVSAEGKFDLKAKITGKGDWKDLPQKLEGPILFSSANGRVKQDPRLARVISVLNVTDIFKGKLPSLEKNEFPYDLVQIKANLKDGKIHVKEGVMRSPAMNLVATGYLDLLNDQVDSKVLASPFTLTDRVISIIPVAGYILGGTLISVPVRIQGSLKDPQVQVLPFSELGSGVWGMMKRTLEAPVKIIEPLVGEEKKKGDDALSW